MVLQARPAFRRFFGWGTVISALRAVSKSVGIFTGLPRTLKVVPLYWTAASCTVNCLAFFEPVTFFLFCASAIVKPSHLKIAGPL